MNTFPFPHAKRAQTSCELSAALTIASVLAAAPIVTASLATRPSFAPPVWIDRIASASIAVELMLAAILMGQGMLTSRLRPLRLGRAYLFAGLMSAASLSGGAATAFLWPVAHIGFAFAIILHASTSRHQRAPRLWHWWSLVGKVAALALTAALAVALTLVLTNKLPPGARDQAVTFATLASTLVALSLVARRRLLEAADLWLAVAMLASFLDAWIGRAAGPPSAAALLQAGAVLTGALGLLVCVLRDVGMLVGTLVSANEALGRMAHKDGLTGVSNRRHLDETLKTEWRRAQRDPRPLSLLLIDVDHFKLFNDRYGHLQGDECLRVVAGQISGMARRGGDLAARYGGEEFALVLPGTDLAGASLIAGELNRTVRAQMIPHLGSAKEIVTVSIGVATARPKPGETFDKLVARADAALYEAKRAGRDQARADGLVNPDPAGIATLPGFGQRPVSR